MKQAITIRKVNIEEADELVELSRETFFDAFSSVNSPSDMAMYAAETFTLEKMLSELRNPHSHFYFAALDNQVIGYLKLNTELAQTEFKNKGGLEIERIYILAKYQGKQFGGQLFNFAIDVAKHQGCTYTWLGVWEHNYNAIRFYQRHGFSKFSSHYFMLGSDKQTDVLMKLQLT